MLLYKNHRFYCHGISFAIPEGFYLDTNYDDIHQDTLNLWSEDKSLYICVGVHEGTRGARQELSFILHGLEDILITDPMKPVSLGGLSGYAGAYLSEPKHYWEAHLHISGEGNDQVELLLLIRSKENLLSEETICELINQIGIQAHSDTH